jgi:hypothetical protein
MVMETAQWVVMATLTFLFMTTVTPCPEKCDCLNGKTTCFNASLNCIPKSLKKDINKLNISHNNVTILKKDDLDGLRELKSIWLNNNGIETVEPEVFCRTEQLTYLDLRNNKLTSIQRVLFQCLKELQYLYLSNNTITFIDLSLFENNTKLFVVDLSNNRITAIEPVKLVNNKQISLLNTQDNPITFSLDWTAKSYMPFNVLDIHFAGTCSWSVMSYQRIRSLETLRQNVSKSVPLDDLYGNTTSDLSHVFKSKLQYEEQDYIYLTYNSTMDAVTTTLGIYVFCYSVRNSLWFWCNDNPYRTFDTLFEKCDKNKNEISEPRKYECNCRITGSHKWILVGLAIFVVIAIITIIIRMTVLVTRLKRNGNRRNI